MDGTISYNTDAIRDIEGDEESLVLVEIEPEHCALCKRCGKRFEEEADATGKVCFGDLEDEDDEPGGSHVVKAAPLRWANSAHIEFDEAGDSIKVGISVSDERGAFTMEIRRTPEGRIIMHLPHASMGQPHAPLKALHEGTFAVYESE